MIHPTPQRTARVLISSILALSFLTLSGCGQGAEGTSEANPKITIQFGSYSAHNKSFFNLIQSAYAEDPFEAKLCFKRLRFKVEKTDDGSSEDSGSSDDSSDDQVAAATEASPSPTPSATPTSTSEVEDNVDFQPGEITLTSTGEVVGLGEIELPAGNYRRLEFDLHQDGKGCTGGNAVSVKNAQTTGTPFTAHESITIRFDGNFTAEKSGQVLTLHVQDIVNALKEVTGDDDIKDRLRDTSVKGSF